MRRNIFFMWLLFCVVACEKQPTASGNGAFGFQLLKIGFLNWEGNEVRRFSGSNGIFIDGYVHGEGLKDAQITMIDTVKKSVIFQRSSNTFVANLFRFQDTILVNDVKDTIVAKITLSGIDANESGNNSRILRIGK
jgi:hypothetical protein